MSDDEREGWRHSLERTETRDDAIENILDRVEQLERELAVKVDALGVVRSLLDEAREAGRRAYAELAEAREAEHIDEGFKLALAKAYSRVEDLKSVLVKALKYFDDLEHGNDQGNQWTWALRNEIHDVLRLKHEQPMDEYTRGRLSQCGIALRDEQGRLLGGISGCQDPNVGRANARRLVACWNACEAFTTEAIEGGIVARCYEESFTLDGEGDESPVGQR